MRQYAYYRPLSLEEAWRLKKSTPEARFIAGGTDLMVKIKNREENPPALISLRSIPGLASIDINGGARIGAMTTISQILHDKELGQTYPVLVEAAQRLGSVQIRNVATVGGNLSNGSPSADMALPLLVLGAKLRLRHGAKIRTVPIGDFFTGPGESCLAPSEILTDILLEPSPKNVKAVFLKKGRVRMDLAIASLAMLVEMEGTRCLKVRIAAGSVAPVPLRLHNVERLLEGARLSRDLVAEAQSLASESLSPITDIRGTAEYRRHLAGVFVRRGLERILGERET